MATGTTETTAGGPAAPKTPAIRKYPASRRRRGARGMDLQSARFFLVEASSNGSLKLGQEVASENEAMVESFRVGGSFAVVTEWKAVVDLGSGVPIIKKEAIVSEKKNSHS